MNSLKERISELMRVKNLTQQQFAEMIKISPASLSSIFNDRTKPTLKHVTAILASFPTINPSWLLNGVGEMYVDGDDPLVSTPYEGSLFDTPLSSPPPLEDEPDGNTILGSKIDLPRTETKKVPQMVKEVKVVETKLRQITEIRIFYDDQTWETFIPKK